MFEIGSSLHDARVRRGLEISEAQAATRIRMRYLSALEEERFDLLPGDAYAKGFLRAYAEFLGLDGQRYVDEFNARFAEADESQVIVARPARPLRGQSLERLVRWPVVAGAAVATALAVLAWQLGGSPSGAQAPPAAPTTPPARPTVPAAPTRPRTVTQKPARTAPAAPSSLTLSATRGACWVLARLGSATGKTLYVGTLRQGQTLRFGLREPVWLRLGAPRNLDASIGGKAIASLPSLTANLLVTRTGVRPG